MEDGTEEAVESILGSIRLREDTITISDVTLADVTQWISQHPEQWNNMHELNWYVKGWALPPLPKGLRILNVGYNQFTTLPSDLPETLVFLDCSYNQLAALPPLSKNLRTIYCDNNQLTSLPSELPEGLNTLWASDNQLTMVPALPKTLHSLNVSRNRIKSLPELPPTLKHLYCAYNQLISLPTLPESVEILFCDGNPFGKILRPRKCLEN